MFSKNLCLLKALLLNYWSTPMVNTCFFSHYYVNNPLRMTHLCHNNIISKIESTTLVNTLYLVHFDAQAVLTSIWKQRYYVPYGGSFNDAVGVEWLNCHRRVWTLYWTWVFLFLLLVWRISGVLWLCFLGVTEYCVFPSLLTSVSNWFLGIIFNMGEGILRSIIEAL